MAVQINHPSITHAIFSLGKVAFFARYKDAHGPVLVLAQVFHEKSDTFSLPAIADLKKSISIKGFAMSRSKRSAVRPSLLMGLVACVLSLPAVAQQANDLGQSFPQATNVSLAPGWNVYRFDHGGVKYIQINSATGQVLAAIGTSNGSFVTLPIGSATDQVSTPQQPLTPVDSPEVKIYDDGSTTISARTGSSGATQFSATDSSTDTTICPECTHGSQH